MRALVVGAEAREFSGLVRRLTGRALLNWPLRFAWSAGEWTCVAEGPGPRLAARAVEMALDRCRPAALVSVGLCGGLAPQLRIGNILMADRIIDVDRGGQFPASLATASRGHSVGAVASTDRVASTVSDKRSLRETGADVVEMEAAAVARIASKQGIPFYCIKSVSDTATDDLILDFNHLRDKAGRFSRPRIIAAALKRPLRRIPALLKLDRHTRAAAESLGEFLADCRF